jgi:hypothetical protein
MWLLRQIFLKELFESVARGQISTYRDCCLCRATERVM